MMILKPLRDMTLLTPYEQYFIQTLYQKGQLIPKQSPGEENPLVHLPYTIPTYHFTEESEKANFIPYSAKQKRSANLPTTSTGTYLPIRLFYILEPTH
jgi:hypothetical protein